MPLFFGPVRIRWWIFAFTLAFAMLSYIQRLGVQDLAGTVMPALHVSQLQIGWLATAFTTTYALAQIPGGIFCQRFGARWTLTVVGILGFIATLAFPLVPLVSTGTTLFGALLGRHAGMSSPSSAAAPQRSPIHRPCAGCSNCSATAVCCC